MAIGKGTLCGNDCNGTVVGTPVEFEIDGGEFRFVPPRSPAPPEDGTLLFVLLCALVVVDCMIVVGVCGVGGNNTGVGAAAGVGVDDNCDCGIM